MHTLRITNALKVVSMGVIMYIVLGCATPKMQEVINDKGEVLIRSELYEINTTNILIYVEEAPGTFSEFVLPNSQFRGNAWIVYDLTDPRGPSGLTCKSGPGTSTLTQAGKVIGKPSFLFFDDKSNPYWAVFIDERPLRLLPIGKTIATTSAFPENAPPVWLSDRKTSVNSEDKTSMKFQNDIFRSIVISAEYAKLSLSENSILLDAKPEDREKRLGLPIGFFIERDLSGQYRMIGVIRNEQQKSQ